MSNYIKKRVDFLNENGYLLPRKYLSKSLRFITNDIAHIASSLAGQLYMLAFFLFKITHYFLRIALLKLHDFKCPTYARRWVGMKVGTSPVRICNISAGVIHDELPSNKGIPAYL